MKQLVNVWLTEKGNQAVNARDLHGFLAVGRDFSTWIKNKIEKYDFVENKDYCKLYYDSISGEKISFPQTGVEENKGFPKYRVDYVITLNMAKELAMVENNDRGKEARKYFIQCEEEFRAMKELSHHPSPEEIKWKKWEYLSKTLEKINDEKQIKAITSAFLKEVTGDEIVPYEKTERETYSATEISGLIKSRYGIEIPRNLIGRLANKYDLKRSEWGVFTNYESKYGVKVSYFHYYEEVIEKLKDIITKYEKRLNINF